MISILYKKRENTVVILHIYGDRDIFLLFYGKRDTLSTYCEMEISTSQLIFTHKNIPNNLWDNGIHTIKMGEKYCGNSSYLWR